MGDRLDVPARHMGNGRVAMVMFSTDEEQFSAIG